MEYEKKYWADKGEYKLSSGDSYIGYVGIKNGLAYIYDTEELLEKEDNYWAQVNSGEFFYDRILDDAMSLPYNKNSINIQANDFLYHGTVKSILEKLQANNDYLYRMATISDTLLPAAEDCVILATKNIEHYYFVGKNDAGEFTKYFYIPPREGNEEAFNKVITEIERCKIENSGYIMPDTVEAIENYRDFFTQLKSESDTSPYKNGISADQLFKNGAYLRYNFIPTIKKLTSEETLEHGLLHSYNLSENKDNTLTALDPTFYDQYDNEGNVIKALYDFNSLVNTEMLIRNITNENGEKCVHLLIFLLFKDKLVIFPYDFYPENTKLNFGNSDINFNSDKVSKRYPLGYEDVFKAEAESDDPAISNLKKFDCKGFIVDKDYIDNGTLSSVTLECATNQSSLRTYILVEEEDTDKTWRVLGYSRTEFTNGVQKYGQLVNSDNKTTWIFDDISISGKNRLRFSFVLSNTDTADESTFLSLYGVPNFDGSSGIITNTGVDNSLIVGFENKFIDNSDILVLDRVDPANKNSLAFLDLADLRIHNNQLFLVDKKLNMALRYDIRFLAKQEGLATFNIKSCKLIDSLQGSGRQKDPIYFNEPCSICADDNNIYIADSGNSCIKVYSSSFNYKKTFKRGDFTQRKIQTISVNPYTFKMDNGTEIPAGSLWIFSSNDVNLYITVIKDNKTYFNDRVEQVKFIRNRYSWDETFKSVKFSFTNSNYFYICTSMRVYKFHLTKPTYPFASLSYFKQRNMLSTMVWSKVPYQWHLLADEITWSYRPSTTAAEVLNNKGFCLIGNDSTINVEDSEGNETEMTEQFDGDIIFHIGTLYNQAKVDTYIKTHNCTFDSIPKAELAKMIKCSGIFLYCEPQSYITSTSKLDIPCYISEEINDISYKEYINTLTFNKMMYKIIYNFINIKNILLGKFVGGYNFDNIMIYDSLEYTDWFQKLRIEPNHSFFIHDNENITILINRIFDKIYDLQEKTLNHMKAKYIAQPSFANNSYRII